MRNTNLSILAVAAVIGFFFVSRHRGPIANTSVVMKSNPAVTTTAPAAPSLPQQNSFTVAVPLKDRYKVIEVEKFDVQEGISFPQEYIQRLQNEIVKEFRKSGEFKQVLLPGQSPMDATADVLRLTGTVTYFDPGSRGKRYVGFGLGSGNIVANVFFRDLATDQPLIIEQVCATFSGGAFGGGSEGIAGELARRLNTVSKLHLEKPLPPASESISLDVEFLRRPAADEKSVPITRGMFDQAQADLNAQAALGYRLVALTPHGTKSADARMARASTPPDVYQYRIFHVQLISNLEKDLNKAALEGYRYCPRTLAQVAGAVGVAIAEKPLVPFAARYTYRLHAAMQLSNAKKDVAKDQRDAFSLAGTMEIGGMHIVLLEKAVAMTE